LKTCPLRAVGMAPGVPTSEAKHHAVELAQSTLGVNETVDELGVAPNKDK
jgi:hypothetical protein